ncbi:MAG: DUF2254 family protein [Acidimicrobiia bacterium]
MLETARQRPRSWRLAVGQALALILATATLTAGSVWLDRAVSLPWDESLPLASVRSFLAAVAGTMVTATVVVFWIRGLLVGHRSSRFPTRVLEGYLEDRYQQRLMGLTIGVFVAAAVVLLTLPDSRAASGGGASTPFISVALITTLTVVALLAIVQSIDTGLRSLNEHRLLRSILDSGLRVIEAAYPESNPPGPAPPDAEATVPLRSSTTGWIQRIDEDTLLGALPPGSVCELHVSVGQFVTPATRVCSVSAPDGSSPAAADIEAAFELGETRSTEHDLSFAVRNLVDVALSGLGSGGNDRTTAREAVVHLGALLRPLVTRDGIQRARRDDAGRWLVRQTGPDHVGMVDEAFEDLRDAGTDPLTARTILAVIDDLVDAAIDAGKPARAERLRRHADLVVDRVRAQRPTPDADWVRDRAAHITPDRAAPAADGRKGEPVVTEQ